MAADEYEGTYDFYMDHLADFESVLKDSPSRKNLAIAPANKKLFHEDRGKEKKIVLPAKKTTFPLIKIKKSEEPTIKLPKPEIKPFLQKKKQ